MKPTIPYADLTTLDEDQRIALIASAAVRGLAAVFVDDEAAADRYAEKFKAYPLVRVVDRRPVALKGATVILMRVGPSAKAAH